jgi:4-hydroxybenzoate polyprenyltransferase
MSSAHPGSEPGPGCRAVRHCGVSRRPRALVDACHPLPTLAVTGVVALLSAAAGRSAGGVALMAAATLVGQLSVGWCNDAYDAERDRRAGRTEKPIVRGDVAASTVWRAAVTALVLAVPLSFVAAGLLGGAAHVVAVLSAWAYDLRLKTTVLSWLPYAVSFGLVPAYVFLGLTPAVVPPAWLVAAAALLGVSAHLANGLPDIESDSSVGAGGAVARLGAVRAARLSLLGLVLAVALLAPNLGLPTAAGAVLVLLVVVGALVVGADGRGLFRFVMAVALLAVVLLLVATRAVAG